MLHHDLHQRLNIMTVARNVAGIALLAVSCGFFAHFIGLRPTDANLRNIGIFPAVGIVWGLLIAGLLRVQKNFIHLENQRPNKTQSYLSDSATKIRLIGNGCLYFSAIGSISYSIQLFQDLDKQRTIPIHAFTVVTVLFLGLLISSILTTIAAYKEETREKNIRTQHIKIIEDYDFRWYLAGSLCVIGCISLVFYALAGN